LVIAGPAPGPAVKVTLVPAQIEVADAEIVGVGSAWIVIVMPALVTLQAGPAPEVATTVTTSPFTEALVTYVLLPLL